MATYQLANNCSHKSQHCHSSVESLNKAKGSLIPGTLGGQAFAERFQRFVLEILA